MTKPNINNHHEDNLISLRTFIRLILGILIVLTSLLIIELILQNFISKTGSSISQPSLCCGYEPKANIKKGAYFTDESGFRITPYDFSSLGREKVYKIVFLGGSIAFGKSNSDLLAYPSYFEFLINSPEFKPNLPEGKKVIEVKNGAVFGYASQHVLNRLKSKVLDLKPDMVIVSVGSNDIPFLRLYLPNYLTLRYAPYLYWYLKSSATSALLKKLLSPVINTFQIKTITNYQDPTGSLDKSLPPYYLYRNNLKAIAEILKERKIKAVFMPWSQVPLENKDGEPIENSVIRKNQFLDKEYKVLSGMMKDVAKEMGIPLIINPLQTPILTPKKNANDFLTTRFHVNNFGSKIIGFSLAKQVGAFIEGKLNIQYTKLYMEPNLNLLDIYYKIVLGPEKRSFKSPHRDTQKIMRWILENEKEIANFFIKNYYNKSNNIGMHLTESYFALAETGYFLHLNGDDRMAWKYLYLAQKIASEHPYPYFLAGVYQMEKRNYVKAEILFKKAVQLDPYFQGPKKFLKKLNSLRGEDSNSGKIINLSR